MIKAWFPFRNAEGHQVDLESARDDEIEARIKACIMQPMTCLPMWRQPIQIDDVVGGRRHETASSLSITFVLDNHLEAAENAPAILWEKSVIDLLLQKQQKDPELARLGLKLAFSTESSIEREINAESKANILTIVISYLVMFAYASLALGDFSSRRVSIWFVQSKVLLGLSGLVIVLCSVMVSVATFSLVGVRTSLIIAEVIPFLALAIGVDNIFILLHAYHQRSCAQRLLRHSDVDSKKMVQQQIAQTLSQVGPSILMSTLAEVIAFALGSLIGMPAIATFAAYAALAVFVGFLLQMTLFVSLMALDAQRQLVNSFFALIHRKKAQKI